MLLHEIKFLLAIFIGLWNFLWIVNEIKNFIYFFKFKILILQYQYSLKTVILVSVQCGC